MCTVVYEDQKGVSDPLELQAVVDHHVSAKNPTPISCKSSQHSDHWNILQLQAVPLKYIQLSWRLAIHPVLVIFVGKY